MSLPQEQQFNQGLAEQFAERLLGHFNSGALTVMISIGHRTGLFDAMADLPPSTSAEIAEAAGLDERYVREWLGAMTVGGVVEHDHERGSYRLPAEHAASLTRKNPVDNMAVFAQYIPQLGAVEDDIVHCFRHGGGVPYERFHHFHDIMAEDSGQTVLPALEAHILPLVPGLADRLRAGIDVLDAGCGSGRALNLLAGLYPNSRFVGYDLLEEGVSRGRAEAAEKGLTNVRFEARDLSDFDETAEPEAFDLVTTFDSVHDQKYPMNLLKGIRRTLRPEGVYLAQDIKATSHHHGNMDHPMGPLLYTVSCMHCMTVSLAQGGDGLGAMWGSDTALRYFEGAGFSQAEMHELEHDPQNAYYVCRP